MTGEGAWIAIKKLRCPKCGGAPSALVEIWTAATVFTSTGDARSLAGHRSEWSQPGYVKACCPDEPYGCGHEWRLRGIRQVADLDEVPINEGET